MNPDVPRFFFDTEDSARWVGFVFSHNIECYPGEFPVELNIGLWRWHLYLGFGRRQKAMEDA